MTTDLAFKTADPWCPRYFTSPRQTGSYLDPKTGEEVPVFNNKTLSGTVKAFAQEYLVAKDGFREGQPITFTKWQDDLFNNLLELNEHGRYRYRTSLVMLPRKNGKTFVAAILIISQLMVAPNNAQLYSVAVDRAQARLCFDLVKFWIEQNPLLAEVLEVKDSKNTIVNRLTGAFYQALSADASSAQGKMAWFAVLDEVHAWEANNGSRRAQALYDALTLGSASLPEAFFIIISTAGENENDSLLGSLYKRGKAAVLNPDDDPAFGFFCWEADADELAARGPWDIEVWKSCNPNLAEGLMDLNAIKEGLRTAKAVGFSGFLRYHLNIWSRLSGAPFMSPLIWNKALNKTQTTIPAGNKITAGFDASYNKDSTAIVIQDYETGLLKVWRVWEKPLDSDDSWIIPRNEVIQAVHDLFATYNVVIMYADRRLYSNEIQEWRVLNGYRVQAYEQDRTTISGAASRFLFNVAEGNITHTGEEVLTRHVLNALADPNKGYKKKTADSRERIDCLAACVMASAGRDFFKLREKPADNGTGDKKVPAFFGARRR
jgi:phage terminase large subunit-like protein